MQIRRAFSIESVERRGGPEAHRDFAATGKVEAAQPEVVSRLAQAVNALPHPFQHTGIDRFIEGVTGEVAEDLTSGRDTALSFEKLDELWVHAAIVDAAQRLRKRVMSNCG